MDNNNFYNNSSSNMNGSNYSNINLDAPNGPDLSSGLFTIIKTVVSFILCTVMLVCLIVGPLALILRYGLFKSGTIDKTLDDLDFYPALDDLTRAELYISCEDDEFMLGMIACIPDNMISDISKSVATALLNNEEIDLSEALKYSKEFSNSMTDYIADSTYVYLSEEVTINADTVRNLPYLDMIDEEIGYNVSGTVIDALELTNTNVKADDVITEEARDTIKDTLKSTISSALDDVLENHIQELNSEFNKALDEGVLTDIYRGATLTNNLISRLTTIALLAYAIAAAIAGILLYMHKYAVPLRIKRFGSMIRNAGFLLLLVGIIVIILKNIAMGIVNEPIDGYLLTNLGVFLTNFFKCLTIPIISFSIFYMLAGFVVRRIGKSQQKQQV